MRRDAYRQGWRQHDPRLRAIAFSTGCWPSCLGKFDNQLRHYDIAILGDPFQPLTAADFKLNMVTAFAGTTDLVSRKVLQSPIA